MDGVEFAYWLQGHFEMLEDNEPLTVRQVGIIREHHSLAKKNDPQNTFLSLMEGLLAGFSMLSDNCDDKVNVQGMRLWLTSQIRDNVKTQFEKVTPEEFASDQLDIFQNPFQTCSTYPAGKTFC